MKREWDDHHERVHAYFGARTDFLELDLSDSPNWGPLCGFSRSMSPTNRFRGRTEGATEPAEPATKILARFTRS